MELLRTHRGYRWDFFRIFDNLRVRYQMGLVVRRLHIFLFPVRHNFLLVSGGEELPRGGIKRTISQI